MGLAGFHVAGQHRLDALAQKRLRKFRVALDVLLHQFLEAFGSSHLPVFVDEVKSLCAPSRLG
jgi:hypothetical protein